MTIRAHVRTLFALGREEDYTRLSTFFIATAYLVLSVAYFFPNELVRAPAPAVTDDRINIIAAIGDFSGRVIPLWAIMFLLVSIALFASMKWSRWIVEVHLSGIVVTAMYCAASFASAWLSPGTYIVTIVFVLFFGAQQWLTFDAYGARREAIAIMSAVNSTESLDPDDDPDLNMGKGIDA